MDPAALARASGGDFTIVVLSRLRDCKLRKEQEYTTGEVIQTNTRPGAAGSTASKTSAHEIVNCPAMYLFLLLFLRVTRHDIHFDVYLVAR
jgi:hypothetical protein